MMLDLPAKFPDRHEAYAWELGYMDVSCASDCLQVMKVLQGNVNVSTFWVKESILRVRNLLTQDRHVLVVHNPWERNNAIDYLPRLASREGTSRRIWRLPPSSIVATLCMDVAA